MRILFSGTPGFGHLLPLLPLAEAARRAGHDVAMLAGETKADVGALPVLPAGPGSDVVFAETTRRLGGADLAAADVAPTAAAELFAGARVDLGFGEALASAKAFGPDLIVCEVADFVGPMVAAALGVPWAAHGITMPMPEAFTRAMEAAVAARYADRGLTPTARVAFVDPWPDALQPEGWTAPADRLTLCPRAHDLPDAAGPPWSPPTFPGREDRPLVLLTLGTAVGNPEMLGATLDSVTSSEDVNVIATLGPDGDPEDLRADRSRVHPVGFVPLALLLGGADLVVSVGGAGTVLGTLSRGVPMVLMPVAADQTWISERLAALGPAAVVDAPGRVGGAVGGVLADPSYRESAAAIAGRMAEMNPPEEALRLLLARTSGTAGPS